MTRPCRGATLIGNCLRGAGGDRRGRQRLRDEDRDLRQGRPESAGRHRPGPRPDRGDDRRGDRGLMRAGAAPSAVEAALAAGAGDAEAYASRGSGREVRVHGGEVESLTAATQRGIGVRAWIGRRVGYAYGTDLSEAGRRGDRRPRRRGGARSPTRTSSPAPPQPAERRGRGSTASSDPSIAELADGAAVAELALAVERAALARRPAGRRGRAGRLRRLRRAGRDRLLDRDRRRVRGLELLRLPAGAGRGRGRRARPGSASASPAGPAALDPEAIGARGRRAGDRDDRRRQARLALLPGRPRPDRRRQLRRPDRRRARRRRGAARPLAVRRRLGEEVAGEALVLHDDGLDPDGLASAPFDGEGVPRRRTALIEGGRLRTYLYDTYTASRGGAASTGSAGRAGYRSQPSVSASNLVVAPGRARLRGAARARPATASSSPTSPACTRASTRSPASSRSAPRGGRSAAASWPSRCASSRSPATWSRCCAPSGRPARSRAGSRSAARSAPRRC